MDFTVRRRPPVFILLDIDEPRASAGRDMRRDPTITIGGLETETHGV